MGLWDANYHLTWMKFRVNTALDKNAWNPSLGFRTEVELPGTLMNHASKIGCKVEGEGYYGIAWFQTMKSWT